MEVNRIAGQNLAAPKKMQSMAQQPSFSGAPLNVSKEIMNSLHHKKAIEMMKKLEFLKGELGGILITAVGTGLVAPIFIGFNPFVKTPKNATPEEKKEVVNTKLYTAMRQPISAALAILFQASVQKYIDKGLDFFFNNPKYANKMRRDINQSDINTDTYIKDTVKKELKQSGEKKPSALKALFSKEAKEQRAAYDAKMKERVGKIKESQLQKIADEFEATGRIKIGDSFLDNETTAKLVNEQIDGYIQFAKTLQKTPDQINHYVKRADILMENEAHLREIFKEIPIKEIQLAEEGSAEIKQLYARTTGIVENLLRNEKNTDVRKLLEEVLQRPEDIRANRIQRTLQRIDTIKEMCGGSYSKQKYLDALIKRKNVLEDRIVKLTASKIADPKAANEKTIKKAIQQAVEHCNFTRENEIVSTVLKNTSVFSHDKEALKKKIVKDVTKGYKKLVDKSYKSLNQITKVLIGVFITLPITCTALNWIYPRFMELFFPKLAGVKKASAEKAEKNGGDK